MNVNELPLTLRVTEVAKIMRISKASAYELTKRPNFPCVRVGRRICIPRDAFLRWYRLNEEDVESLAQNKNA